MRESSEDGAREYADIFVGDTITCEVCGNRVTATVLVDLGVPSYLTVLVGDVPCIDGSERHPWPNESGDEV